MYIEVFVMYTEIRNTSVIYVYRSVCHVFWDKKYKCYMYIEVFVMYTEIRNTSVICI